MVVGIISKLQGFGLDVSCSFIVLDGASFKSSIKVLIWNACYPGKLSFI